jgi:diguanylate cyclase (GGDEF)-like protein/PAS domain S-box-containing protein
MSESFRNKPSTPLRVVIAEDDAASRKLLHHFLEQWGYNVCAASDGLQALELLRSADVPTLAILDWMMPGMDGIEVCRTLRTFTDRQYVYVLMLTALDNKEHLIEGLEAGADDYVAKPFDPAELKARLLVAKRIIAIQSSLNEVKQMQALAASCARSGAFDWDMKNNLHTWSPEMEDLYGLAPGEFAGNYLAWESLILPQDVPVFREALAKSLVTGQFNAEWRIAPRNGREVCWVGARGKVFFDGERPVRLTGINLDINAQKQAERTLSQQATMLNEAHEAIITTDLTGAILYWNQGASQIYGWSAEEAIGRRAQQLLQTRFPLPIEQILATLHKEDQFHGEFMERTKDGRKVVISTRWSLRKDEAGTPIGVLVISSDITHSRQMSVRREMHRQTSLALAESNNLPAAASAILGTVCEQMQWEFGALWMMDDNCSSIRSAAVFQTGSRTEAFARDIRAKGFAPGEGIPGKVWSTGRSEWIEHLEKHPEFTRKAAAMQCGLDGGLSFPVIVDHKTFAVFEFFSVNFETPSTGDVEFFTGLGRQIGEFVVRMQAEAALALSEHRYRSLVEDSNALICTHDLDGKLLSINSAAARSVGLSVEQCIGRNIRDFMVLEAKDKLDWFLSTIQEQKSLNGKMELMDVHGRRMVWSSTSRLMEDERGRQYVLGHAQDITEQVVMQKELLKSQEAALEAERKLARVDSLTGLANRRAFYEGAELERKRALRRSRPLSIAYLDLDNFKQINDRNGHEMGDELLACVGGIMRANLRAEDMVARLGGDEFAVLLPESDYQAASIAVTKLHRILSDEMQKHCWPVGVSLGMVTFESIPENVEDMVHAADELMYNVKRDGKNRIALSQVSTPLPRTIEPVASGAHIEYQH